MRWEGQNLFVIAGISLLQRDSFPLIYFTVTLTGFLNVVRYNVVFAIAGFVIAECHYSRYFSIT